MERTELVRGKFLGGYILIIGIAKRNGILHTRLCQQLLIPFRINNSLKGNGLSRAIDSPVGKQISGKGRLFRSYPIIRRHIRNQGGRIASQDRTGAIYQFPILYIQQSQSVGIGLYRSEFLLMNSRVEDNEEEQFRAYRSVLEQMGGKPVTIRTFDMGGDKVVRSVSDAPETESNPILGWRSIRFCLDNPKLFKTQLRALFRAGFQKNLRVMFPMISGTQELLRVYKTVEEVKDELRSAKIPFNADMPIGIMIEVPSAAMTSDILAKYSDFFSIGTNDLIQYTIAVDRGNERIAYLYEAFHPGVLRMLRIIVQNAHKAGISVSMCGEMAGDPLCCALLIGLGLDGFSMSSAVIPEIKRIIRSVTVAEAEILAGQALELETVAQVRQYVEEWMSERFGEK